ncbi:hypothetical protein A9Q81_17370 [Gammaproteobacteria bacterium 42_54_T18]|nr:hypothetical protein A9Q81_17370 [Gammaproteobacteria bacterium 42_54_T18]
MKYNNNKIKTLAISSSPWIKGDTFRWVGSFVLITALHIGAALFAMNQASAGSNAESRPLAAIMIDLAPAPVAPKPKEILPEPEPKPESKPTPSPKPKIKPLPITPIIKHAKAIIPSKPIEKKPEPEVEKPLPKKDLSPEPIEAPEAPVAAAPTDGELSLNNKQSRATWQSALFNHLARHKRYPRLAKRNREEAVILVRVIISRDGMVLNSRLEKPSEFGALNKEALALVSRAQPLPAPPPEVKGETIEFVIPVEFSLRR